MKNIISKHTQLISNPDIKEICSPLNKFNISYFSHVHVGKRGNFSGLSNNPQFSEFYLKNAYYNSDIHMAKCNEFGEYVLWDVFERTGETAKMDQEAAVLGIKHTFTIIENNQKGSDFYHFSTHIANTSFNQVYLSNLDLLKLFIIYFKDSISQNKKLQEIYQLQFLLDTASPGFELGENKDNQKIRSEFLTNIPQQNCHLTSKLILQKNVNKAYLQSFLPEEHFTDRQLECILLTLQGKSAKQVGNYLGISQRTVEEHLANIKNKLGVYTKAQLIEKILNTNS